MQNNCEIYVCRYSVKLSIVSILQYDSRERGLDLHFGKRIHAIDVSFNGSIPSRSL